MNANAITYRKLEMSDSALLQRIGRQTYYDAFWEMEDPDNIAYYLQEAFSLQKMQAELHNQNSHFYFAEIQDETIGYLKLNFDSAQTDLKDSSSMEIERLYLRKEFKGKQLGTFVLNFAIEKAKAFGKQYVWLGVWEKNYSAIKFYHKNSFIRFGEHPFQMGKEIQTDYLMKLNV